MTILLLNCRAENFEPGAGSESGDNPRTPASEPARSQPASPKKRRKVSRSQSIPAQVMASLFIDLIYIFCNISFKRSIVCTQNMCIVVDCPDSEQTSCTYLHKHSLLTRSYLTLCYLCFVLFVPHVIYSYIVLSYS